MLEDVHIRAEPQQHPRDQVGHNLQPKDQAEPQLQPQEVPDLEQLRAEPLQQPQDQAEPELQPQQCQEVPAEPDHGEGQAEQFDDQENHEDLQPAHQLPSAQEVPHSPRQDVDGQAELKCSHAIHGTLEPPPPPPPVAGDVHLRRQAGEGRAEHLRGQDDHLDDQPDDHAPAEEPAIVLQTIQPLTILRAVARCVRFQPPSNIISLTNNLQGTPVTDRDRAENVAPVDDPPDDPLGQAEQNFTRTHPFEAGGTLDPATPIKTKDQAEQPKSYPKLSLKCPTPKRKICHDQENPSPLKIPRRMAPLPPHHKNPKNPPKKMKKNPHPHFGLQIFLKIKKETLLLKHFGLRKSTRPPKIKSNLPLQKSPTSVLTLRFISVALFSSSSGDLSPLPLRIAKANAHSPLTS